MNCQANGCRDGDLCYKCSSGYYVLDGQCSTCPNDCSKCENSKICQICNYGYYLNGGKC